MKFTKEQILGVLRHGLTALGGFLIGKGILDESTAEIIIASFITLAGTVWSVIDKNKK
jgi:hypothetical protein